MDAFEILVIILSSVLTVFLVLSIVFLVICIKIAKHVKAIINKAEAVMDDVESVSDFFKKSAMPVAIGKLVGNLINTFSKNHDKQGK